MVRQPSQATSPSAVSKPPAAIPARVRRKLEREGYKGMPTGMVYDESHSFGVPYASDITTPNSVSDVDELPKEDAVRRSTTGLHQLYQSRT